MAVQEWLGGGLISTMAEFLNFCPDEKNASMCLGIILENAVSLFEYDLLLKLLITFHL